MSLHIGDVQTELIGQTSPDGAHPQAAANSPWDGLVRTQDAAREREEERCRTSAEDDDD